jgi:hypothetical protein
MVRAVMLIWFENVGSLSGYGQLYVLKVEDGTCMPLIKQQPRCKLDNGSCDFHPY